MQGQFKPDVTGWGQRGTLSIAKILETMKDKVADAEAEPTGGEEAKPPAPSAETGAEGEADGSVRRSKRLKVDKGEDTQPAKDSEDGKDGDQDAQNTESKDAPSAEPPASAEKPGMTVEEYEAMLDAEAADWDFPDGV